MRRNLDVERVGLVKRVSDESGADMVWEACAKDTGWSEKKTNSDYTIELVGEVLFFDDSHNCSRNDRRRIGQA